MLTTEKRAGKGRREREKERKRDAALPLRNALQKGIFCLPFCVRARVHVRVGGYTCKLDKRRQGGGGRGKTLQKQVL